MFKKTFSIIFIIFCIAFSLFATHLVNLQTSIAKKIIRLHVVANSDSAFDQAIKLKVRDSILKEISPRLSSSKSLEESRAIINNEIQNIQKIALNTTHNYADYNVLVSLKNEDFPTKIYGDFSFPAGNYETLNVTIGDGLGKNWWCVMFPPLCFTNSSIEFDDNSIRTLQNNLSDEEYKLISESNKSDIKIKFRLLEVLN